jgi:hypothetical protein
MAAKGTRKFLVSIASSKGGGRSFVFARSPKEAASAAVTKKFGKTMPKHGEVIVTDLSKQKNNQDFYELKY